MKNSKKWGEWSDDELVLALEKELTAKQVSEITGRSVDSVYHVRRKYQFVPKDHKWTVEQEQFVIDHPNLSYKQLGLILNRTTRAVRDKKYKLKQRIYNQEKELYFAPYDGKTIRQKRRQLKINIHDLASYCGVDTEAIRNAEIGDPKRYKTLRMLATIILKDFEDEVINWEKMKEA